MVVNWPFTLVTGGVMSGVKVPKLESQICTVGAFLNASTWRKSSVYIMGICFNPFIIIEICSLGRVL